MSPPSGFKDLSGPHLLDMQVFVLIKSLDVCGRFVLFHLIMFYHWRYIHFSKNELNLLCGPFARVRLHLKWIDSQPLVIIIILLFPELYNPVCFDSTLTQIPSKSTDLFSVQLILFFFLVVLDILYLHLFIELIVDALNRYLWTIMYN